MKEKKLANTTQYEGTDVTITDCSNTDLNNEGKVSESISILGGDYTSYFKRYNASLKNENDKIEKQTIDYIRNHLDNTTNSYPYMKLLKTKCLGYITHQVQAKVYFKEQPNDDCYLCYSNLYELHLTKDKICYWITVQNVNKVVYYEYIFDSFNKAKEYYSTGGKNSHLPSVEEVLEKAIAKLDNTVTIIPEKGYNKNNELSYVHYKVLYKGRDYDNYRNYRDLDWSWQEYSLFKCDKGITQIKNFMKDVDLDIELENYKKQGIPMKKYRTGLTVFDFNDDYFAQRNYFLDIEHPYPIYTENTKYGHAIVDTVLANSEEEALELFLNNYHKKLDNEGIKYIRRNSCTFMVVKNINAVWGVAVKFYALEDDVKYRVNPNAEMWNFDEGDYTDLFIDYFYEDYDKEKIEKCQQQGFTLEELFEKFKKLEEDYFSDFVDEDSQGDGVMSFGEWIKEFFEKAD